MFHSVNDQSVIVNMEVFFIGFSEDSDDWNGDFTKQNMEIWTGIFHLI